MKCRFCGAENPDRAIECSVCLKGMDWSGPKSGEAFRRKPEFHPRMERMVPRTKTVLPFVAGGILVANAILAFGGLLVLSIYVSSYQPDLNDALAPLSLIFGGVAAFVMIGGVLAMLRRGWGVAVVACVVSFFLALMFGLFCGIVQAMVSVAALAMLIQSRHEF